MICVDFGATCGQTDISLFSFSDPAFFFSFKHVTQYGSKLDTIQTKWKKFKMRQKPLRGALNLSSYNALSKHRFI